MALKRWAAKNASDPPSTAAAQAAWVEKVRDALDYFDDPTEETALKLAVGAICDAAPARLTVHVLVREKLLSKLPPRLAKGRPATELKAAGLEVNNVTASWKVAKAKMASNRVKTEEAGATPPREHPREDPVRLVATLENVLKRAELASVLKDALGDGELLKETIATPVFPVDASEVGDDWSGRYEYSQADVKLIGEFPHFHHAGTSASKTPKPSASNASSSNAKGKAAPPAAAVGILLELPRRTAWERLSNAPKAESPGWKEAVSAQSKAMGDRPYLILPKPSANAAQDSDEEDSEDEEEEEGKMKKQPEISAETHCVAWLPPSFWDVKRRVRAHMWEGAGETDDIKRRMMKGNTDTGNLKVGILAAELNALKHDGREFYGRDWALRFSAAMALADAVSSDTYFLHDNEDPDECEDVLAALAGYLKNSLLSRTDEEIGIGAPGETPDPDTGLTPSRQAVYHWLDLIKRRIGQADITFNATPGKKRKKRRTKEEMEADRAAKAAKKEADRAAKEAARAHKAKAKAKAK